MTTEEVTCRVLVIKPHGSDEDASLTENSARVCLKDCPNVAVETRLLWARDVAKEFLACSKLYDAIRPWEFILNLDGTIECLALPPSDNHHDQVYPARFRIPSHTLLQLDQEEKNKRSEMFALGSLLYEIISGKKPFEELSDDEVQLRFSNGDFPGDITSLQLWPTVLSCWNLEFSKEIEKIGRSPYHFCRLKTKV
jgi:serine/threonine protein kinase